MCGLFGIATRKGQIVPEQLQRATQSLAHRGPDDCGTITIRVPGPAQWEVGLAHRRLAILDLSSSGHQPMYDAETGNWVVFNGEIYNFASIRDQLRQQGVGFSSKSDTEVLLRAYSRWGESCLHRLRGMFSFAIWDQLRKTLFLARDPIGIKPLYYSTRDGDFLFASELRTLLKTGLIPPKLDRAGLENYLQFGSVCDPNSMIEGISALEPGSFLVWQAGSVRKQSYWSFPQEESGCKARAQYRTEIRACLKEAVCMQTVSDVPVGVFLSGGIDSSSLVALLREGSRVIDTFSIVFREPEYDEGKFSRRVAERFGSRHHEILLGQHDILKTIPEFLNAMDQPTIDGLNTYLISREARAAGIKVVLNGIGGDELFAGYSTFHTVPKMEKFLSFWTNIPMPLKKSLASLYEAISVSRDSNRKLAELARENGRLLHPYFLSRSLFTLSQRDRLLRDSEDTARASTPLLQLLRDGSKLDPINRVSLFESRLYMLNTLLRDADVMSMAHGLELRVPLLDAQLAEKVFTLPGSCKIGKGRPKPLLVDALDRGLPRQVVHRRKQGFTLPFEQWLRDELRLEVQDGLDRLANGPLAHQFNPGAVRHIWNEFWRHRTSWSRPWSLYVLQRWCEQHSVSA